MNFLQSPPNHYPTSRDSTLEVFRTRNFSVPTNAPSPPGYHAERAPPRYQDVTEAERGEHNTEEGARKARKIRWVRIASSIFIVTTVSLIVAGVVGKIDGMKAESGSGKPHDGSSRTTVSVAAEGTAHAATEDVSSVANEAASPTITATESDTGDFQESVNESPETEEGHQKTGLETTRHLDHIPSSAHTVTDRDIGDACGGPSHPDGKHASEYDELCAANTMYSIECLEPQGHRQRRAAIEEICDFPCLPERLVGKSSMNEWDRDSG